MGQVTSTLKHVCPAVLASGAAVFGQKRRLEHATGLLDAVMSDVNYAAFAGEVEPGFQDRTTGHVRDVRITWDFRNSVSGLTTGYDSLCDLTCENPTNPEQLATIDYSVGQCITRTDAEIRRLCSEWSQIWEGQLKQRGTAGPPAIMADLGRHVLRALSVVRAGINAHLRHILNAQAPTFVFAGPSPTPAPLALDLTSVSADYLRTGALIRMMREFAKAEYTGEIIVVSDMNSMYDASKLLGIACCNSQGVDARLLATDNIYYFLDKGFNSDTVIGTTTLNGFQTGTNEFIAWIPGALRLVSVNDFVSDDGNLGLAYGGNFWQSVIPDPIYGDRLLHDVRIAYDGCGNWNIQVGNRFDLLIKPNMYTTGDDLFGVRDVFRFVAGSADPCIQTCPGDHTPVPPDLEP